MMLQAINNSTVPQFKAVKLQHRDDFRRNNDPFFDTMHEVFKSNQYPKGMQIYRTTKENTDYDRIYLFFGMLEKDEDTFVSLLKAKDIEVEQTEFFFVGKNRTKSLEKLELKRRKTLGLTDIEIRNCEKIDEGRHYF